MATGFGFQQPILVEQAFSLFKCTGKMPVPLDPALFISTLCKSLKV